MYREIVWKNIVVQGQPDMEFEIVMYVDDFEQILTLQNGAAARSA